MGPYYNPTGMELPKITKETILPGCYVRLRLRTESEITNAQGSRINQLYMIAGGKIGRVISVNKNQITNIELADVVFGHMDHISRVDTRYLDWLWISTDYSDVAPGDCVVLSDGRVHTVSYFDISKYITTPGYYTIFSCDNGRSAAYSWLTNKGNVIRGERKTVDYTKSNLSKFIYTCLGDNQNNHLLPSSVAKNILNSYYGIHSFNDKEAGRCQCEKPVNMRYGFNHAMIYTEPFTIDKDKPDKLCSIDQYDIIKEMQKMKESIKKPVTNPIEKVIFNPPATIVFWKDGSKTVVKAQGDVFNPETGLAMAISRHYLCDVCGLERYDGVFNRYLPKDKNKE